jgi:signal transduction histidine kinase
VLAIWSVVAMFSVLQMYVSRTALGHRPPLGPVLLLELPVWAFWAGLTVPVVMLARRFPLDRSRPLRGLAVHAIAAITVGLVAVAFQMLWYQAFNPYPMPGASVTIWFWEYFRRYFVVGVVMYWAVVGVYHAFANYLLYRARELEATRAKAQLTEARLRALRMQLHPHFLFNTLNSVSALVDHRPAEARRILALLADLLRVSLRTDARHVIPLEDEIRFLERYLDIEQVRFGERLWVTMSVEPETRRAATPSFLFQPLVENAIRHGIAQRDEGGRMWISARRRNGSLVIHVMDDGPGIDGRMVEEGIGLSNTRRRLGELYGAEQSLSLSQRPGGGLDVRVEIPFRPLEVAG